MFEAMVDSLQRNYVAHYTYPLPDVLFAVHSTLVSRCPVILTLANVSFSIQLSLLTAGTHARIGLF
jgi:hypothetical protein